MNYTKLKTIGVLTLTGVSFLFSPVSFAKVTPNPTKQAERIATVRQQADTDVQKRLDSLNDLITKVKAMKHLTDGQKNDLTAKAQSEITTLNNLKTKIDADTDLATLRADRQAVFNQVRVYALFIPSMHIVGAADNILDVVTLMQQLQQKLQDRVNQAKSSGKDVTALQNALNDMQAKVTDAQTQAQNAINTVTLLVPDGGDKTKFDSNKTALENARNLIKTAESDLKTARGDAQTVRNGLK